MDLLEFSYADEKRQDLGVLSGYKLDLAFGAEENNFELTVGSKNHICKDGYYIYAEGTEYGGLIHAIRPETSAKKIVYIGFTWHGIINNKVLEPDAGKDYLIVSGDANAVLQVLINRMALSELFEAADEVSGINIKSYQFPRYAKGYDGIRKMLKEYEAKLLLSYEGEKVVLKAAPIIDYAQDDEFDSDQIDFIAEKNYLPVNHMICLGRGELKEREVVHLYADKDGNISHVQTLFGMDEVSEIYENTGAESIEELEKGGADRLREAQAAAKIQLELSSSHMYDIGDIIGVRDNITGVFISAPVSKKIVTIDDGKVSIEHKVGENV